MEENYKHVMEMNLYKIRQIFFGKHSIQIQNKHMASICLDSIFYFTMMNLVSTR